MASIELRGKYAVGDHRFALVDDADFAWLSAWGWKAKWNAGRNNIYAVRVERIDGKSVDIRMHREVLGLKRGDPRDVDHKDHFGLNNRRANLRTATRSENCLNARRINISAKCGCGLLFQHTVSAMVAAKRVMFCSKRCARQRTRKAKQTVLLLNCSQCGSGMLGSKKSKRYCSDACRGRAKRVTRRPSLGERLIAALPIGQLQSAKSLASAACAHETEVRRIFARLVREGAVRIVKAETGMRGRPGNLYQRVEHA